MDPNASSPLPCPNTVTVRRNPLRKARATPKTTTPKSQFNLREIQPFPTDEICSEQAPAPEILSLPKSEDENLKVFLRIRPLPSPNQAPRAKPKTAWPQNPTKKNTAGVAKTSTKKSSTVCISVNDAQSVTLSTPLSLQESKRIKSETYGGFSHVFSSDSSQLQVYERMVKPMVEEFLKGRNGMLAALGPSGSGKTHTVFGTPRDPGMVPLALRNIFKETVPDAKQASRSFSLSVFEIYSERGKAEKLFDLLPDGGELNMQQSTVKGLKEVLISNAEQAESLIAQAVLKRATAMTNTNNQSSRSQCIINIRDVPQKCKGVVNPKSNGAVLTIIDLAGAEREKRTGNQGTRLLESNFINNTLMVFSLCLRSLLEHQKNPKKPLQKHFQNSTLTRYLRDYLEGKKRMTLILTARSGEEDYLDTSYLLRQASPYMQIKYDEVEPSNAISRKRHYQALSTMDNAKPSPLSEHLKRMKVVSEHIIQNDEKSVKELNRSKEDVSTVCASDVSFKSDWDSKERSERSHIIMQNFAKVIWNMLKQYNSNLKVAETEIQNLKESIGYEKKKYLELETQLSEFKACCTCCKGETKNHTEDCSSACPDLTHNWEQEEILHSNSSPEPRVEQISEEAAIDTSCKQLGSDKLDGDREVSASFSKQGNHHASEVNIVCKTPSSSSKPGVDQSDEEPTPITSCTQIDSEKSDGENLASSLKQGHHNALGVDAVSQISSETLHGQSSSEARLDQLAEEPTVVSSSTQLDSEKPDREISSSSSKPGVQNALEAEAICKIPSESIISSSLTKEETVDPLLPKDVSSTKTHNLEGDPPCAAGINNSCKPPKPKRTLMPSSSMLSRDLSTFDLFNEFETSKGKRGTRKLAEHDTKRSNGSISLLHLLQGKKSNTHR